MLDSIARCSGQPIHSVPHLEEGPPISLLRLPTDSRWIRGAEQTDPAARPRYRTASRTPVAIVLTVRQGCHGRGGSSPLELSRWDRKFQLIALYNHDLPNFKEVVEPE